MVKMSNRPKDMRVYIRGRVPRSVWSLHVLPASAWVFSPASSHRPSHAGVAGESKLTRGVCERCVCPRRRTDM